MAERLVFLIDADAAIAARVSTVLQGNGLRVLSFADGNEALAQKEVPALIILCIDPKRLGWAICNRMKKSASLKGVPLIVTSEEASEKDFEDHKQLKNRAEEYLQKPFAMDALIDKVVGLIGDLEWGGVEVPGEDVSIEDDLDVEVEVDEPPPVIALSDDSEEAAAEALPDSLLIDEETDAAFDAIGAVGLARREERAPSPPAREAKVAAVLPFRAPPMSAAPINIPTEPDLDLGLSLVAAKVTESSRVGKLPGTEGEVARLREEVLRLQREIEEARSRKSEGGSVTTFSREREFLNLREVINKKEKEILDLRDAVDARDRQILDSKDKLREGERARRDLDEKLLGFEKEAMGGRERVEALSRDKETSLGREKGLKARLDEAQKKLERAFAEGDEWKTKHAAAEQAREAERARAVEESVRHTALQGEAAGRHERANEEQRIRLEAALEAERRAHSETIRARDEAHADEMASLRAAQAELMGVSEHRSHDQAQALEEQHRGELAAAERRRTDELERREVDHRRALEHALAERAEERQKREREQDRAIQALDQERAAIEKAAGARVEALEQALRDSQELAAEQGARLVALEQEGAARTDELVREHSAMLQELASRYVTEKEQAAARHRVALDLTEKDLADAQRGLSEAEHRQVELLEQQRAEWAARLAAAEERHTATIEAERRGQESSLARLNSLGDDLATRERELQLAREKIAGLSGDLSAAGGELAERDRRLTDRAAQITEFEAESAELQEQVLAAHQRIKSDATTVGRAKKALAIALTLLDEDGPAR
ncbi:MAG: response regulator [Myxococcales bacterium]|nr:response regulator [Myxococcales bacterium]